MSANRETIAKVHDIPSEQVKCANCTGHNEFINGMFYCDVWDLYTMEDAFCSFFAKQDNTDFFTKGHLHLGYAEED